MCGINGIVYKTKTVEKWQLEKANKALHHRGPDASGCYISKDRHIGFGHARLSFLDLSSTGNQPITDTEQEITVVLNGEIYNYIELRQELQKKGYQFRSQTDTEVLIHGWKEWKQQLPEKLEGMFSFAILDEYNRTVFIARDRFGIKPLYYYYDSEKFIFGSEIKALLAFDEINKKVRPASISLFLANRYIPAPHTIWEGIKKVRPGYYLLLGQDSFNLKENQYWRLKTGNTTIPPEEASENFHYLLRESLKKHLRSDVPIGAFLSGGYDSSALVYMMQRELDYPTDAFSIGFTGWEQSEDQYAKIVADTTGAALHTAMPESVSLESVKKLMWHYDDPIADISIIPTYEVSRLASGKVKAVVSGEGADEMLAGYWWHKPEKFAWSGKWTRFRSRLSGTFFKDIKYHYIQAMSMGLFDQRMLHKTLSGNYYNEIPDDPFAHFDLFRQEEITVVKQLQYLDIYNFMSELVLTKVDRASMAHSLEVRVPFLNHQLVEFIFSLSPEVYIQSGIQKKFIRNILKNNVPDQILNRSKQGFVGPDKYYMDYELYKSVLINGMLVQQNVIKQGAIHDLVKNKDHWRLWKLFVLENWWQVWMC